MTPDRIKELRDRDHRQQHPAGAAHSECDKILGECLDASECLQQEIFSIKTTLKGFQELSPMWKAAADAFEAHTSELKAEIRRLCGH